MKFKVKDVWYDSDIEPLCLQVNEVEQRHIAELDRSKAPEGKYGSFPLNAELSMEQMLEFIEAKEDTPDA